MLWDTNNDREKTGKQVNLNKHNIYDIIEIISGLKTTVKKNYILVNGKVKKWLSKLECSKFPVVFGWGVKILTFNLVKYIF